MATDVPNIGRKFLEEIDDYLAKNWRNLTCTSIYNVYFRFFNDLKEFKGNSNGFTGLSEYLVFRFLCHLLGGLFDREQITRDLYKFVSKSNKNISIGQSARVSIDKKRYYPDIVVWKCDKIMAVIQIKLYLTNGVKELDKEAQILKKLIEKHPQMQALLLIFNGVSKKGKIFSRLQQMKHDNKWLDFLILQGNDDLLHQILEKSLGLKRITSPSPW